MGANVLNRAFNNPAQIAIFSVIHSLVTKAQVQSGTKQTSSVIPSYSVPHGNWHYVTKNKTVGSCKFFSLWRWSQDRKRLVKHFTSFYLLLFYNFTVFRNIYGYYCAAGKKAIKCEKTKLSKQQRIWGFLPCPSLYCDRSLIAIGSVDNWPFTENVKSLLISKVIKKIDYLNFKSTVQILESTLFHDQFRSGLVVQSGSHFRSWDHLQACTSFKRYCPATTDNDLEWLAISFWKAGQISTFLWICK